MLIYFSLSISIGKLAKALSTNSSIVVQDDAIFEREKSRDLYLCARCASGDLHAWNSSNNFSISSFLPMLSITSKKSGVYDNSYNNSILIILAKLDVDSTELDEEVSFTFDGAEILNEFDEVEGE